MNEFKTAMIPVPAKRVRELARTEIEWKSLYLYRTIRRLAKREHAERSLGIKRWFRARVFPAVPSLDRIIKEMYTTKYEGDRSSHRYFTAYWCKASIFDSDAENLKLLADLNVGDDEVIYISLETAKLLRLNEPPSEGVVEPGEDAFTVPEEFRL